MASPLFYLSYARPDRDADPETVDSFFGDLVQELKRMTGLEAEEIGFLDGQSIAAATEWPDEVRQALAECRSFVAMLSPAYFASSYCGREWAVFQGRIKTRDMPLILPVLLTPVGRLPAPPAAVRDI